MSGRTILVVVLSLICGASAALGVNRLRPAAVEPEPAAELEAPALETAPLVFAAVDIPRGKLIEEVHLEVRPWPKDFRPQGAIGDPEELIDRAASMQILAGEPVVEGKVAALDAGRGLAALVPTGMRAYTIQARTVGTNVAGFILPGNKVDILLTLRGSGREDESGGGSTTTLLQAVEILAVGQELDPPTDNLVDPRQVQSATLLVTPDQAAMLDLGQSVGQLSLALRNPEDILPAITQPALLSEIRYRQEKPVAEAEQAVFVEAVEEAAPREIVTMRGRQRGSVLITPVER